VNDGAKGQTRAKRTRKILDLKFVRLHDHLTPAHQLLMGHHAVVVVVDNIKRF
jgi:hypothetical protein